MDAPSLRDIQGQAGLGSEQPDLAVGVPIHCGELNWMTFKGLFQLKRFYDYKSLYVQFKASICCLTLEATELSCGKKRTFYYAILSSSALVS